jgi:hypothetical protein
MLRNLVGVMGVKALGEYFVAGVVGSDGMPLAPCPGDVACEGEQICHNIVVPLDVLRRQAVVALQNCLGDGSSDESVRLVCRLRR